MAKVNLVNKNVRLELEEIIRFQLITHCHVNKIQISDLDLECLSFLGVVGSVELTTFCEGMAERRLQQKMKSWDPKIHKERPEASPQTIRNILMKMEKKKLLVKEGKSRKKISLNPDLQVQTNGNIILNYKFVRVDT